MKKFYFSTILLITTLLCNITSQAQLPGRMDVPNSNFEEWTEFAGDSLDLFGNAVPIYDAYRLPTGWAVPVYTMDETLSYSGFNLPIHIQLPVAKASRVSVHAPQGQSALAVESFSISDALSPMAYMIASSLLDSAFTETVLPTVAATADIHLDKILPLLEQLTSDYSDMSWLLSMLDTVDINDYFSGGFALNGLQPKLLRGYYKYHDASPDMAPDNGCIVAFGTRYDTLTHRRMLVGAGSKNLFQLYDTVNYEPFEMNYTSLSDYYPQSYGYYDADSMVVMVVSSASDKAPSVGSILYIDSLWLEEVDGACGRVYDLQVTDSGLVSATIAWHNTQHPDHWEVEYGPRGFYQGYGELVTVEDSAYTIGGLRPSTEYDCYVRALCSDTAQTAWIYAGFRTKDIPQGIEEAMRTNVVVRPCPAKGHCVVDCKDITASHIKVFSMEGRVIMDKAMTQQQIEVELPHKGIYIVELQTTQGTLHQRIISE